MYYIVSQKKYSKHKLTDIFLNKKNFIFVNIQTKKSNTILGFSEI